MQSPLKSSAEAHARAHQLLAAKQFVRAFYDRWNEGGWQEALPLIAEDFDDHYSPPACRYGREGFIAARQATASVLSNIRLEVGAVLHAWIDAAEQIVSPASTASVEAAYLAGERMESETDEEAERLFVLAEVIISGDFVGPNPLRGIPPTGTRISFPAWSLFRLCPTQSPTPFSLQPLAQTTSHKPLCFQIAEHWELQNPFAVVQQLVEEQRLRLTSVPSVGTPSGTALANSADTE